MTAGPSYCQFVSLKTDLNLKINLDPLDCTMLLLQNKQLLSSIKRYYGFCKVYFSFFRQIFTPYNGLKAFLKTPELNNMYNGEPLKEIEVIFMREFSWQFSVSLDFKFFTNDCSFSSRVSSSSSVLQLAESVVSAIISLC